MDVVLLCFFFFKQKTAYEMRISDWSSDVCSSDLLINRKAVMGPWCFYGSMACPADKPSFGTISTIPGSRWPASWHRQPTRRSGSAGLRSEEHTSELQSLMRISYAVFCLKKKNIQQQ